MLCKVSRLQPFDAVIVQQSLTLHIAIFFSADVMLKKSSMSKGSPPKSCEIVMRAVTTVTGYTQKLLIVSRALHLLVEVYINYDDDKSNLGPQLID